jgi:hypothetical protein
MEHPLAAFGGSSRGRYQRPGEAGSAVSLAFWLRRFHGPRNSQAHFGELT